MDDRKTILKEIEDIEREIKELEILYEQYFAGVEKREPIKQREALAKRLRRFVTRKIIQTDLRFRYQTLATRFHSYATHWDRILRLIDEGRYVRQVAKKGATALCGKKAAVPDSSSADTGEKVYQDLLAARQSCGVAGSPPDREQIMTFLAKQKDKIHEKFGNRDIEFRVEIEDGKPKIKVRAKK